MAEIRLAKGQNLELDVTGLVLRLSWSAAGPAGPENTEVDGSALLLGPGQKVRGDHDFVFYNQPQHPSGSVSHAVTQSPTGPANDLHLALDRIEPDVERVVITASAHGRPFGSVSGLRLTAESADAAGQPILGFDVEVEPTVTAVVVGEVYRRNGAWRLRNVSQGYDAGLAGLAIDYGIAVDDEDDEVATAGPPAAPAVPPPAPVSAPMSVSLSQPEPPSVPPAAASTPTNPTAPSTAPVATDPPRLSLDKGSKISLAKNQTVDLVKQGKPLLSQVQMGLGWDPAKRGGRIDLDASALVFDASGKVIDKVWFLSQQGCRGAIQHSGDNLTGAGDGDDEVISVDLAALPPQVAAVAFTVNSFSGQKLNEVSRAYARLLGPGELVRFELREAESTTGVLMAVLRRTPEGHWAMEAVGAFHAARTVRGMAKFASKLLFGR